MGIICSTDDTNNWHKTFKGGEEATDPYETSFPADEATNPYDTAPVARPSSGNVYYPPPSGLGQGQQRTQRAASSHPRAY